MATRRSSRKRKVSERVRVVDGATLAAARARRLDALEADADDDVAAAESAAAAADSDYEASDDDVGPKPKSKAKKGKKKKAKKGQRASSRAAVSNATAKNSMGIERWNKPLAVLLDEAGDDAWKPGAYFSIEGGENSTPPRALCSVCGFEAAYSCSRCLARFCSLRCGTVHEETRCLKFTL